MARAAASRFSVSEISALLDSIPGSAFIVGPDRRILADNRNFRDRFTGGRPACGRTCFETSHGLEVPCDRRGVVCPVMRCLASGGPHRVLHVHQTGRGKTRQDVNVYPIPGERGGVRWVLGVIRPSAAMLDDDDISSPNDRVLASAETLRSVGRVAPADVPVLLLGENGTGKQAVARTVHRLSPRSNRPFVPLDCPTFCTLSVWEWGHNNVDNVAMLAEPWALALAEAVRGGTLYLNEVGRVSRRCQGMLLRLIVTWALADGRRPTAARPRFRLISATARDLGAMVRDGRFRSDLYFRISGFPIRLAPLRHRLDELPELVAAFLDSLFPGAAPGVRDDAVAVLRGYDFPGNLDELRGILEVAGQRAGAGPIGPGHLPEWILERAARRNADA